VLLRVYLVSLLGLELLYVVFFYLCYDVGPCSPFFFTGGVVMYSGAYSIVSSLGSIINDLHYCILIPCIFGPRLFGRS
jgi:hypothetical protein